MSLFVSSMFHLRGGLRSFSLIIFICKLKTQNMYVLSSYSRKAYAAAYAPLNSVYFYLLLSVRVADVGLCGGLRG